MLACLQLHQHQARSHVFIAMSSIFFSTRCLHFFFFFFCTMFIFFYKLKQKGSLRCSFCFYVDSNRGTAQARNERRLSASRDIRSIRVATTVPCQQHQRESLLIVSLFRAIVELSRYDDIISISIYILRCQRQYVYQDLVIRNASFAQLQTCLVTMALCFLRCQRQHSYFGQFRCVPYRYLFLSKILT